MTFQVVQLRLITWEELPLMKSDIGWVYIIHSKVFILSSHIILSISSRYTTFPSYLNCVLLLYVCTTTLLSLLCAMLIYNATIGGCNGGDLVEDTPAENEPYFGCIPGDVRDTCPQLSGLDPINNFMDYAEDLCMTGRW